jgi:hypothetical protein
MRPLELLRAPTMLVVVIALASAQAPKPTDGVAWGSAVDGLRIGAAFGSDPSKPTLRVLFQNVGSVLVKHVIIGAESGRGPIYNLKFIATAPDGMEREGVHVSGFGPVAGVVLPLSIWLDTGVNPRTRVSPDRHHLLTNDGQARCSRAARVFCSGPA